MSTALQVCGSDILAGGALYDKFRTLEVEEYEDLMDTEPSQEAIKESKQRIIRLIHGQLGTPLAGNEEALQSISSLLSDMFTESETAMIRPEALSKNYSVALGETKCSRHL